MLVRFEPLGWQFGWPIFKSLESEEDPASVSWNETKSPGQPSPARWVGRTVHWLVLVLIAAATLILLYGLFRWASADAGIDAKIAKDDFHAEQDWCRLHRSAIDAPDRQR